jgi:purine-binding chemotaxis protein CheW
MENKEYDTFSVVVIFQTNNKTVGMIVDEVSDVLNIEKEEIQDTPEFSTGINTKFVKGIGKVGKKLVIILDIEKILTNDELLNLNKVSSGDN